MHDSDSGWGWREEWLILYLQLTVTRAAREQSSFSGRYMESEWHALQKIYNKK